MLEFDYDIKKVTSDLFFCLATKGPTINITDRNILVNFLRVVIHLALVANIQHETWMQNVLQVNCYASNSSNLKFML